MDALKQKIQPSPSSAISCKNALVWMGLSILRTASPAQNKTLAPPGPKRIHAPSVFCPGGGIGRHAGLRSLCLTACEFESRLGHHFDGETPLVSNDQRCFLLVVMPAAAHFTGSRMVFSPAWRARSRPLARKTPGRPSGI